MPLPRRAVAALVLSALTVVAVILAVLAIADPFHLRHARWFSSGLVLLAILFLTATLASLTRRWLRWLVLLLGFAAMLAWAGLVWFATGIAGTPRELTSVAQGDRRLVLLEGAAFAADPVYAVVVRSGGGLFEQESIVYQGLQEGSPPTELRFIDNDSVEIRTGSGCDYVSQLTAGTLDVDPVHAPLTLSGC